MKSKVSVEFYLRDDTLAIARDLLGKLIVVADDQGNRISGMIVETEAYLGPLDRAAHSYGGRRTPRNEVTYGPGGHAYVFFIYGMYYQLNIVCDGVDRPYVVLIRGVEPIEGVDIMRTRRGPMKDINLTSGPGKLCIAFGIDRGFNGEDLLGDRLWLEDYRSFKKSEIAVGRRVGIDYAGEDAAKPWRFWVRENQFVTRK